MSRATGQPHALGGAKSPPAIFPKFHAQHRLHSYIRKGVLIHSPLSSPKVNPHISVMVGNWLFRNNSFKTTSNQLFGRNPPGFLLDECPSRVLVDVIFIPCTIVKTRAVQYRDTWVQIRALWACLLPVIRATSRPIHHAKWTVALLTVPLPLSPLFYWMPKTVFLPHPAEAQKGKTGPSIYF